MSGINVAGLLVIAVGAFFVVMALRNTQSKVFPQLFSTTQTDTQPTTPTKGAVQQDKNGKCPAGYDPIAGGWCLKQGLI